MTTLMFAGARSENVRSYIFCESDFSSTDDDFATYDADKLCLAAKHRKQYTLRKCIAAGANVNATDGIGRPAIIVACQNRYADIVGALIAAGANHNPLLHYAAQNGMEEVIRKCLAAGTDVNACGRDGKTSLMLAAENNHVEIMDTLITAKSKVNLVSRGTTRTALHYAAQNGFNDALRKCVSAGANFNMADIKGKTALHYAAQGGFEDVVQTCIDASADVNTQDLE